MYYLVWSFVIGLQSRFRGQTYLELDWFLTQTVLHFVPKGLA